MSEMRLLWAQLEADSSIPGKIFRHYLRTNAQKCIYLDGPRKRTVIYKLLSHNGLNKKHNTGTVFA